MFAFESCVQVYSQCIPSHPSLLALVMIIMATVSECHSHMSVSLAKMSLDSPDFLRPRSLAAFIYVFWSFWFTWYIWFVWVLKPFTCKYHFGGTVEEQTQGKSYSLALAYFRLR